MAEATGTQAIDRAAQLLVRVVESAQPPSVGELAERAGLPKTTTSRLVSALERQGLVQRLGDRGRLTAGPVLLRYANRDVSSTLVELARRASAASPTPRARRSTSPSPASTASSTSRRRTRAHFVGVTDWVGRKVPFEHAANGKVFLAFARRRRRRSRSPRARLRDLDRRARDRADRDRRARARPRRRRDRRTLDLRAHRTPDLRPHRAARAASDREATQLAGRLGHRDHARGAA